MHFSNLKMAIWPLFSCVPVVLIQCPSRAAYFRIGKTEKKTFFYDLSFILYTDANEPLYNRIYTRGRTEMIYAVAWAGKISALSRLNPSLYWHAAKNCPARCMPQYVPSCVRYVARCYFYSLMGLTHKKPRCERGNGNCSGVIQQ